MLIYFLRAFAKKREYSAIFTAFGTGGFQVKYFLFYPLRFMDIFEQFYVTI